MRVRTRCGAWPATIAALAVAMLVAHAAVAGAATYYSSPTGTDPTDVGNWWSNPDGTGTNPADFASGDVFVIQPGYEMSTTSAWTISGAGSGLWIQSGATLAVGDGAANRLDLVGSTFQLDPYATYVHASTADWDSTCFNAGVTRHFEATSTVVLRATHPRPGTDINWGNLTIALTTSPGADWGWDGRLTRVHGDLTVTNTGGYAMRLAETTSPTLTIDGNLVVNGGNLQLGSGTGAANVNVAGNLTVTSGTFGSSSTGVDTVAFTGGVMPRAFTQSGGTLAIESVDWQVDTRTLTLASDFALPAPRAMTIASTASLAVAAVLANAGTLAVNGTLRLEAGGSVAAGPAYGGGAKLVYAGGSVSTGPEWGVSGPDAPLNVTVAAGVGSTVTLSGDRTVPDTLTFVSGTIATGADTLTLGPACVVAGAGAGAYVFGNLARVVPAALATPLVFDVGDATHYAPVEVAFDTVGVPGTLAASTAVPGLPPPAGEPPTGSGISQSAYVDRSWTLTTADASPLGFGSCSATFHFGVPDVRGGGEPGAFIVARDSAGTWSHPAVGEALATSITATGLAGFGEFRAGEPAEAAEAPPVSVSQVYGGGGGEGSTYTHDFVELFNRGVRDVDVTGWTVQYAAAGDSAWSATVLAGTIPPGGYYLVQQAGGGGAGLALPAPDATGNIAMDAQTGKVALVSGGGPLSGACPADAGIVDLVGYGGADCAETSPVGALSDTTAALRDGEGCDDTGDNLLDFTVAPPAPRNSLSPVHYCTEWVGVEPAPVAALLLAPVAPNPARGGARVSFALPAGSGVRLRVLDLQGRAVATLVDGVLPAGRYDALWDGTAPGGAARSGLYFVRLEACGQRAVRSLVLVR